MRDINVTKYRLNNFQKDFIEVIKIESSSYVSLFEIELLIIRVDHYSQITSARQQEQAEFCSKARN